MRSRIFAGLLLAALPPWLQAGEAPGAYAPVEGGEFRAAMRYEDDRDTVTVKRFELMRTPVTHAQFQAFVRAHQEWRRDRVPAVFGEARYLSPWPAPDRHAAGAERQPVTWVSWFAADAYCRAQGARLPTWTEWEFAAAADATRADARNDPAWRERILAWYSKPGGGALPPVGLKPPDLRGIHDLHGLVWEWVDDASALLVSVDNREQGAADKLKFCGAGALSTDDRENYAILMRVAMLSSLGAADATANMGFRCARTPQ